MNIHTDDKKTQNIYNWWRKELQSHKRTTVTLSVGAQSWRPDAAHEQACEETISSGWKWFSLFKRTHTWLHSWGPNIAIAQQKASTLTNCYRPEVQQYYSAGCYELCFAFLSRPRKYTVLCRVWSFVCGLSFTSKGISVNSTDIQVYNVQLRFEIMFRIFNTLWGLLNFAVPLIVNGILIFPTFQLFILIQFLSDWN